VPWSGAPDSVRCTREFQSELTTFGNSRSRSPIIHRTVRCSTGLSGAPVEQRLLRANGRLQRAVNALQCAQKSEQRQKAHRTVNSDCPVHHRTVRCASGATATSRQRSSAKCIQCATVRASVRAAPEGAPDSVQRLSGATPDCPVTQKIEAPTVEP